MKKFYLVWFMSLVIGIALFDCQGKVVSCERKNLGQCLEYSASFSREEVEKACRGGEVLKGVCPKGALAKCETSHKKVTFAFYYYPKIIEMGQNLPGLEKICKVLKGKWSKF